MKKWPFRLGTTSFIYPDNIIPNVKQLGKNFKELDEIEILIFESIPKQVLPSKNDINELVSLGEHFSLNYNIHLPIDISICDNIRANRIRAIDTVKQVIDLCAPLKPTTHTLHMELESRSIEKNKIEIERWRDRISESLDLLIPSISDPGILSIETLNYPFEIVEDIIDNYGLSICIDAGHMIKYNFDINRIFRRYKDKIPIIHLHGVDFSASPPKDHTGLDKTPDIIMQKTMKILSDFKGTLSLEVFNYKNFKASLKYLNKNMIH